MPTRSASTGDCPRRWSAALAALLALALAPAGHAQGAAAFRPADDRLAPAASHAAECPGQLAAGIQRELQPDPLLPTTLAVGDVDGDGRDDLYVCRPGGLANQLFLQLPDGSFAERAAELRLDLLDETGSALLLDLDGDGDLDLACSLRGAVAVFEQRAFEGRPRFGLAASLRAAGPGPLAAADVDGDGDLDLLAACAPPAGEPASLGAACRLFLNPLAAEAEQPAFRDATLERGLGGLSGRAAAAAFWDADRDGDPDLFIAGEGGSLAWLVNERGHFAPPVAVAWSAGEPTENARQANARPGDARPGDARHGDARELRSLLVADADGDGAEELLASWSGGCARLAFDAERRALVPLASDAPPPWPALPPEFAEGGAVAALDLDADGRLDFALARADDPGLRLFERSDEPAREGHCALRLVGQPPNRDAVGARLELSGPEGARCATVQAGGGWRAQSSAWLELALAGPPERAVVHWPDGTREAFAGLAPGRSLLVQASGRAQALAPDADAPGSSARVARPGAGPGPEFHPGLFAAPIALPRLDCLDAEGVLGSLSEREPHGRLLALPGGEDALASLTPSADEFAELGLKLVRVVARDPLRPGEPAEPGDAGRFAHERSVEPRTLAVLTALAELTLAAPGPTPCAVLLDPGGRLRAVYRAAPSFDAVAAHARLFDADPVALRDASVPGGGRWVAAPPRADLRWLAARLSERGFEDAAAELRLAAYETRELTRESMLVETALVRRRQGNLPEALKHLDAARELAPDWPPLLSLRGRVLLELGRAAEAFDELEAALWRAPDDAAARRDLERAASELGLARSAAAAERSDREAPGTDR